MAKAALNAGSVKNRREINSVPGAVPRDKSVRDGQATGIRAFSTLGRFLTSRPKVVLLVWLVLFAAAAWPASRVSEVMSSGSGGFGATDAESTRAQDLIDLQFPRTVANSSAIIVMRDPDVTSARARDFALRMEDRLTVPGALADLESLVSIYSVERELHTEAALGISPVVSQANLTAYVIWGIPATFLADWRATDPDLAVAQRDSAANNTTYPALVKRVAELGADNETAGFIFGYYSAFYGNWQFSASNATLVADPDLRAQTVVDFSVPLMLSQIPDPTQKMFVERVWNFFDLVGWDDRPHIFTFVNEMFRAAGQSPMPGYFLGDVLDLGPRPTRGDAEALAAATVENHTLADYPVPLPEDLRKAFVSAKNDTMILILSFSRAPRGFGSGESDPIVNDVHIIRDAAKVERARSGAPAEVFVTGNAATTADAAESGQRDFERVEPATIIAVVLLVSLFFLALVAVLLPLFSIMLAIVMANAMIFFIGTLIVKVSDTTSTFLFTIMLGVGIDYAVFIMARYREERMEGAGRKPAVATAVTWAGESITTSGATVIIAFGILSLGSFEFIRALGLAVGIGVILALLVSLTLIPAVLTLVGNRVFWPSNAKRFARQQAAYRKRKAAGHESYFRRAAKLSVRHAKLVLALAALISIPTTYISLTGATTFDFIAGLPETESLKGIQAMQDGFGAGQLGPTYIVAHFPDIIIVSGNLTPSAAASLESLSAEVAKIDNVKSVTGPTRPLGTPVDATNLTGLGFQERAAVLQAVGKDGRTALITVILEEEPFTRRSIETVGKDIRGLIVDLRQKDPYLGTATVLVGGQSALTHDFAEQNNAEFRTMMIIVTIAVFIVLLLVLGSYLLPLSAVASVALSITWAYALTLLFFNNVLHSEVLFLIPLILFVLLMGIGMDYNIFILTRIREEAEKGKSPARAAIDAVDRTGSIITALALILASALGSLMLSENRLLQGFGFAIAVAVLLDAMVVRTYLVPATMAVLGERAWWGPKFLRRVRPTPRPAKKAV